MVVAAVLAATTIGCVSETPGESLVVLVPVASSEAPLSYNFDIALADENTACVINSFEFQVHCADRTGKAAVIFGGEGEGPGEFRRPSYLRRGPAGTLGVFDLGLERLTVFEPTGGHLSEATLPPGFRPVGPFGSSAFGSYFTFGPPAFVEAEVDVGTGEILWERRGVSGLVETECGEMSGGLPTPAGGWVFQVCKRELVFFADRDADNATVVYLPNYVAELPSERDVDAYLTGLARLSGNMSLPASAMEPYAAGYREDPRKWFQGSMSLAFDNGGRLWIGTTRDRDAFSYLDVWVGTDYAGTVRIRDRLIGYDLMGSTLAALVDRAPGPEGVSARAIDWYDIDGMEFGS